MPTLRKIHPISQRYQFPFLIAFLWAGVTAKALSPEDAAVYKNEIRPALATFCGDCHRKDKHVSFLSVTDLSQIHSKRGLLRSCVSQLRNRTMPPADEDQPTEIQRLRIANWLERVLRESAAELGPYAGSVTARRLNRLEYDNTIRDLLGLKMRFSETFPADGGGGEGFNNNGETLFLPVILMERYLEAAQAIVDQAVLVPAFSKRFLPTDFSLDSSKQPEVDRTRIPQGAIRAFTFPALMDADFAIRLRIKSPHLDHPSKISLLVDGISAKTFDISLAPEPEVIVHLSRGDHRLGIRAEAGEAVLEFIEIREQPLKSTPARMEAHRRIFGDLTPQTIASLSPEQLRERARQILTSFARKAFRRPLESGEKERLLSFYERGASRGDGFESSVKLGLKAVLVSPQFLYRTEREPTHRGIHPVSDHELAVRLSYFLWNSTPDEELSSLADSGQLHQPETLKAQLKRMLADPKVNSFLEDFTGQWLGTKEVGDSISFTQEKFKGIYTTQLADDLRKEAVLLVGHVLTQDRPLTELIMSEYTFLNERIAKHYGIEGIQGNEFRQVPLSNGRRGGVLGLGAVHMLTSHPTQTSPVLRGGWVLQTLLGTPVPPPPPNVPPLEAAAKKNKGASLREQLAKHREDATCGACHNVIDPIGFALENFDVLGRWRDLDEKNKLIDSSGKTASGMAFSGFVDFKRQLLESKRSFLRQITSKLLGYALGRSLDDRDDGTIEGIVEKLSQSSTGGETLLREIILSTPFRNRESAEFSSPPAPAAPIDKTKKGFQKSS